MRDQIFMSRNNAEVVVAIPLFNLKHETLEKVSAIPKPMGVYAIIVRDQKPVAYILDAGKWREVYAAEWVEKHLVCLGEL